jgi:polysaccharide transporter, PST family
VPVIQILAVVGLMQSLQGMNSGILQACDRAGTLLRCAILTMILSLVAFAVAIGMEWGIIGVAAAYAIASCIAEPYYAWQTMRTIDVSVLSYMRKLAGIVAAALGMAACVLAARFLLLPEDLPAAARLAVLVVVGALTYVPLWAWRAPEVLAEFRGVVRRRTVVQPAPAGT